MSKLNQVKKPTETLCYGIIVDESETDFEVGLLSDGKAETAYISRKEFAKAGIISRGDVFRIIYTKRLGKLKMTIELLASPKRTNHE